MDSAIFALVVLGAGALATRVSAIYWQVIFCLFGAAAALTLPNGAVITPSNLFLPFLAVRAWSENLYTGYLKRFPSAGFWLAIAALYGIVTAVFVPRALEGQLTILTADRSGAGLIAQPLRPVSTNFTQSVYALAGVVAFLSFRALLERPRRLQHFCNATLLLTALNCFAGLLTLGEFYLGFPPVLSYVRNAYALFDAYEGAGGLVRIHGTFSETSAYAAFGTPLFAFSFNLWLGGIRSAYSGPIAALQLVLLLVSTSSTAYAGLLIYGAILSLSLMRRERRAVPRLGLLTAGALLSLAAIGSIFVFETKLGRELTEYFSITLFDKLQSSSGVERSDWNLRAWQNFLDTAGIGVGLGTARASSFALVLLSNLGLLGTCCYLMFVGKVLGTSNRDRASDRTLQTAFGQAMLAALAVACVSATVYDLGVLFYGFAAGASTRPQLSSRDLNLASGQPWNVRDKGEWRPRSRSARAVATAVVTQVD